MDERVWKEIVTGKRQDGWSKACRAGLALASLPYGLGVRGRNTLFDLGIIKTRRIERPIVSVGNLTVGGTGKTPVVEWIARWFREHDRRVVILSRGYGAEDGPNDEALVLEENLPDVPHLQGKDRGELARIGTDELDAEVFVLDDGFQHRQLARDLDIVLIDALHPFGNERLLPAGFLREPVKSLRRADLVLLTRSDLASPESLADVRRRVRRFAPKAPVLPVTFEPTDLEQSGHLSRPARDLAGLRVACFAGIGHPEAFVRQVRALGATVVAEQFFPDHYPYRAADVASLDTWAAGLSVDGIVTTQKDAVKLRIPELGGKSLWAMRIRAVLPQESAICDEMLFNLLSTPR